MGRGGWVNTEMPKITGKDTDGNQGPKTDSLISTFPPNATQEIFQSGIKYKLNRKKRKLKGYLKMLTMVTPGYSGYG